MSVRHLGGIDTAIPMMCITLNGIAMRGVLKVTEVELLTKQFS